MVINLVYNFLIFLSVVIIGLALKVILMPEWFAHSITDESSIFTRVLESAGLNLYNRRLLDLAAIVSLYRGLWVDLGCVYFWRSWCIYWFKVRIFDQNSNFNTDTGSIVGQNSNLDCSTNWMGRASPVHETDESETEGSFFELDLGSQLSSSDDGFVMADKKKPGWDLCVSRVFCCYGKYEGR